MIYKLTDGEFRNQEFLELVELTKSEIIYHVRRMHFFAFDGFVMYTFKCDNSDFNQKALEAIGFSNIAWIE